MTDPPTIRARYPLLIGGRHVETEQWHPVDDPFGGDDLCHVAAAGPEQVDAAVRAAEVAGGEWARTPPTERAIALERYAQLLDEHAGELAELMHQEMGKPLPEATAEVARALEVMHYFAAEAERVLVSQLPGASITTGSWMRPAPLGVVAAITPWNFPVALIVWKLGPALAAGCSFVAKPAGEAPLAAWRVCELAIEAGLPDGLVNCVTGDGPLVGEALATHPKVAKVAFTGSRRVAEQIAAWTGPRLKALSLELGGHGPLVVLRDADLDQVAEVALIQGYANAGQACYSVNRVLAPPEHVDEILERIDDGRKELELGPMATDRGVNRHLRLIADAASKGATVRGGERLDARRLEPALVSGAGPGVELIDEEPFTPIVAVMALDDIDAALAEANRPDYGLVGYVCGGDLRRSLQVAERLECGTVVVNGWRVVTAYAPYAGWKGSGVGAELGRPGLEAFVRWQHLRVLA
jgi:succinate-semialdehyde dehydrogenase/glutarate-semialdehyde dehydrogenase